MLKQIIYGKRQTGKTKHVCQRMLRQENSIYVCYDEQNVKYWETQYPQLKGRFMAFSFFLQQSKLWLPLPFKRCYFEWLNWIYMSDELRHRLRTAEQIVIFDDLTHVYADKYDGIKFIEIKQEK